MSVLTLADAKAHLNKGGSVDDVELQKFIDAAESVIGSRCGPLVSTQITKRCPGRASSLRFPITPVLDLVNVTAVNTGEVLNLADLMVSPSGIVEYIIGWGVGWARFWLPWYDVTVHAGNADVAANVPPDLLYGVKELVRHLWETQRGRASGRGLNSVGSNSYGADIIGAAYMLVYRVMEPIQPYLRSGIA